MIYWHGDVKNFVDMVYLFRELHEQILEIEQGVNDNKNTKELKENADWIRDHVDLLAVKLITGHYVKE